jgi:hypothetical protein
MFRLAGGGELSATSFAFDRAQVAPMVSAIDALPHGSEIAKLKLDVATAAEVGRRCGREAMSCYDPWQDEMVVDGQDESVEGVPRLSLLAHEYGHHIANNRGGGIWSAFDAGTTRWSTYEEVCERTREGLLFPGNEGAHYWENPGEAFAQTYATLVAPETPWTYTPLLAPDPTALGLVREDVVDPLTPRQLRWQVGSRATRGPSLGEAVAVDPARYERAFGIPVDGRVGIRLTGADGGRYRLLLIDATTGESLAEASPDVGGTTKLHYADCGHRQVKLIARATGSAGSGFDAAITAP